MTLWTRIRLFFAPPVFEGDEDKTRIAALLNIIFLATFVLVLMTIIFSVLAGATHPNVLLALAVGSTLTPALWFAMRRGYVRLTSVLLTSIIIVQGTVLIYFTGTIRAPVPVIYIVGIVVAGLLVGVRVMVIVTLLSSLAVFGFLQAEIAGWLPPAVRGPAELTQWISYTGVYSLTAMLLGLTVQGLNEALGRARRYATELEEQRNQLADLLEERTRDLVRRTSYLGATTAVSREATLVLGDPQQLLARVVNLVSEQFGFYHTGLFLLDPSGEWAELSAASSAGGQRMLDRGHRLRVGVQGIVGDVAGRGVHRIALDVDEDAAFLTNPDLPDTRSEMALPLRARGEIIGVLDVQSTEPEAFGDEDVTTLQALANQVAMAISSTRLFQQVEESAAAERRAYGALSREAWMNLLRAQPDLGFFSDERSTIPAGDLWRPEMRAALRTGEITPEEEGGTTLAIPIKVRDQIIGVIDGRKRDDTAWTPSEIELLETLTVQLGAALESARLYEDSQRRAARERLTAEITDKMRRAAGIEDIVQTAVDELYQALGTSRAFVRLGNLPAPADATERTES